MASAAIVSMQCYAPMHHAQTEPEGTKISFRIPLSLLLLYAYVKPGNKNQRLSALKDFGVITR